MSTGTMERHHQQQEATNKEKQKAKQKFRSQIISKREFLYGCGGGGHQDNGDELSRTRVRQTKRLEIDSIHERHSN